jgi:hypothetical protein
MLAMKKRFAHLALYVGAATFFITLVYFALLADAFYSGGDTPRTQTAQMVPTLPLQIHEPESVKEPISINQPENGKNLHSGKIDVNGKAPGDCTIVLFVNGKKVDQVESRDGLYRFENVELAKQANVLQTRFLARDGSSASSKAILVFHRSTTSNLEGK